MKKAIIIIGVVFLSIIVIAVAALKFLSSRPAAPKDYQQTTQTGGEIEATYLANGPYDVSVREDATLLNFGKFTVYYPSELETADKRYPVIVLCNGSGTPLSKYPAVAEHYASWGFIAIGTEEPHAWNAFGAEMSLRYLERWNENAQIEDAKSVFYQKVDFENVGVVGHSQGGVGVINAITDTKHKYTYKTAVSLSPTNKELAHNLFWDYDASLVDVPILLISGAGGGDDWVVTGEQLQAIYDDISSDKCMARRCDTAHGEVLYRPDGYVTAWFMWQLQGDEYAAQAFTGDTPELMTNSQYQDQKINID
jgi:dienelactone hydrolase